MAKKNAVIYGLTVGETIHYIGKTIKVQDDGHINNSDISLQYRVPKLRAVFKDNDVTVVPIKNVPLNDWYDDKLGEVIEKHKDDQPLLNAQWMKEGKRGYWSGTHGSYEEGGYWSGKTRDAHTIQRLCESKFKLIAQYDSEGDLQKIWGSGKEIAKKIFNDYKVINGSAKSIIYGITKATTIKGHFRLSSYWFRYDDLMKKYNTIPSKINIPKIRAEEQKISRQQRKKSEANYINKRRYTILHFKNDVQIAKYDNIFHAGYNLRISSATVRKICAGNYKKFNPLYDLRYGEKELQRIDLKKTYPRYKVKLMKKPKKIKPPFQHTRTKYSVEHVIDGVVVQSFKDTNDAAIKLGLPERKIRTLCTGRQAVNVDDYPSIRYGKKITKIL